MAFDHEDQILARRIKALAHPARLGIVRALMKVGGDGCCCGDIVSGLPLAQSTVSQHLKVLREAGLIHGEIAGPRSCYCLDRQALAGVVAAMAELGAATPMEAVR